MRIAPFIIILFLFVLLGGCAVEKEALKNSILIK